MTRTAVISDIHGNFRALQSVLEDIRATACDRIVCLGDLVDGFPYDLEVVREIQGRGIPTVRGNHDDLPIPGLPEYAREYLRALPESLIEGDVCYTHISPRESCSKVASPFEAWNVFDEVPWRLVFVGHVHYPVVFGERSEGACSARICTFRYNLAFPFERGDRYIISVGAVGYNRDGIDLPRYGIYDDAAQTMEIRKVGPVGAPDLHTESDSPRVRQTS